MTRASVFAIGEVIRELKSIPSGHLYAQLVGKMDLAEYQAVVAVLVKAGVVTESTSHLLTWVKK